MARTSETPAARRHAPKANISPRKVTAKKPDSTAERLDYLERQNVRLRGEISELYEMIGCLDSRIHSSECDIGGLQTELEELTETVDLLDQANPSGEE